jgi:hypothetical protein
LQANGEFRLWANPPYGLDVLGVKWINGHKPLAHYKAMEGGAPEVLG